MDNDDLISISFDSSMRRSLDASTTSKMEEADIPSSNNSHGPPMQSSFMEHMFFTISLWMITYLLSLFSDNLSIILSLTGSVAASVLGYIGPGLLYIQSYYDDFTYAKSSSDKNSAHYTSSYWVRWERWQPFCFPIFMIIFGLFSIVLGCATVFIE